MRTLLACSVPMASRPVAQNPPGAPADFAVSFVTRALVEPLEIPDPVYELRIPGVSPGENVWNIDAVVRSDEPCAPDAIREQLIVHIAYFSSPSGLSGFTVEGPALAAQMDLPEEVRRARRARVFERLAEVAGWRCPSRTMELWQARERLVGVCEDANGESRRVVFGDNDVVPTIAGVPL